MEKQENTISKKELDIFYMVEPLLSSVLIEIKSFANKKQDGILSLAKVNMINKILIPAKELFKDQPVNDFLEILDKDSLPSYSDTVIVIVQYEAALRRFRSQNIPSTSFDLTSWD
ncbi:hypothetical protein [Larkinella punicea]|uniref:Uncharacterized protein n=1 Tax=Larkinella punicea TaxID=2315727 RepID=A0A368JL96_9BACT|nr:hypothetical protein [Larkinella punicea]RCR67444.1 hypothetical protein DUE52_21830 [Larkinella punicea]